jgi:hypothetical protein
MGTQSASDIRKFIKETFPPTVVEDHLVKFSADFFQPNEQPLAVVLGCSYEASISGMLWLTNHQIFHVAAGKSNFFSQWEPIYHSFKLGTLSHIEHRPPRLLSGATIVLHVFTTSARGSLTTVSFSCTRWFEEVQEFVARCSETLDDLKDVSNDPPGALPVVEQASSRSAFIEELAKISELKEKGLLTDREFILAKKKLLGD